jgi:hypothetical protein
MTAALNFTPKAIADLAEMAAISPNEPRKRGLLFIANALRRAEVFILPDMGQLLDRSKPYPEVPASMFRPPFQAVALEYRAFEAEWEATSIYNTTSCSRRIALAWEWDGLGPQGLLPDGPRPGEAVAMASSVYVDKVGKWVPVPAAAILRYEAGYTSDVDTAQRDELVRTGAMSQQQAKAPALDIRELMPIMPDAIAAAVMMQGEAAFSALGSDLRDEVNAYRDLCLALACNNVSAERQTAAPRLNKQRIKAGKPPLKDFHVLTLSGSGGASEFGAAGTVGGGVRSHLRRGHIRRLGPERVTWVNACMVRGSRPGFVDKQYAPRPAGGALA